MSDINTSNTNEWVGDINSLSDGEERQALFAALDAFAYVMTVDQI